MSTRSGRRSAIVLIVAALLVYFADIGQAKAVPSFSRKYQTSCLHCHTIFPALNPEGEAFRRNGYRMPSMEASRDTDLVKGEMIPLGQEAYEKMFPEAVWPDKIMDGVPLSAMANGAVSVNIPGSEAREANGNAFTWNGLAEEFHIFGAGSFSDNLTYFTQLTINSGGIDIETGYLLWNDVVGPNHLVNLWLGRLMGPSLTSFGMHSSYLGDANMPAVSVAGLYNPNMSFVLGPAGHADGIELNGIVGHRVDYALGWVASGTAGSGIKTPNAQDVYAHIGAKIGGLSLDGEGGSMTQNAMKPWAETSLTLDVFGYSGTTLTDTGINANLANPVLDAVHDHFQALGGQMRLHLASLQLSAGAQVERHNRPYPGTAGAPADPTTTPPTPEQQGTADNATATAFVQYNELDYVIFPWFVPGVRTELTRLNLRSASIDPAAGASASLLRVIPGVAMLARPNIKVVVTADLEWAHGLPPVGSWSAAGGYANNTPDGGTPAFGKSSKFMAEQVTATVAWAF